MAPDVLIYAQVGTTGKLNTSEIMSQWYTTISDNKASHFAMPFYTLPFRYV